MYIYIHTYICVLKYVSSHIYMAGLVKDLKTQEAHFIRCVKPNMAKKPSIFESPLSLRQLRYAGLFEAISIRKSGYAYRNGHKVSLSSLSL